MNLLDKLNKRQLEAVKQTNGPVRIIAGPGSGKTRTIISKVAYILEQNYAAPHEILVITFTNKAANEIKEKLLKVIPKTTLNVFTYHGWSARFLRIEAQNIGQDPDYRIIDRDDQKRLLKSTMKESMEQNNDSLVIDLKDVLQRFDEYSINPKLKHQDEKTSPNSYAERIAFLHNKYLESKRSLNALDFNDLLIDVHDSLKKHHDLREKWASKYKYIFVDEFQDTNNIQYDIIKYLTTKNSNITVVGDPDQNIYSWRGANIKIILDFDKHYKNTKTVILNQNYRSTPQIIFAANKLIDYNKDRITFDNVATKPSGAPIAVLEGNSKAHEAWLVVNQIRELKAKNNLDYHDMAIIYRANYISREFETQLINTRIPYILVGGFKFFERKEVKDAINYLHFLIHQDDLSLRSIINLPVRGVGEITLAKLIKLSHEKNLSIWDYLNDDGVKLSLPLQEFVKKFNDFIKIELSVQNLYDIFRNLLIEMGVFSYFEQFEDRLENISGFVDQLRTTFNYKKSLKPQLREFFSNISLVSSGDIKSQKNHLTLITGHASKGTEFPVVFVVGLNEDVFPSKRADTRKTLEEERRTAYVAFTRAMDYLFLTYSHGDMPYPPYTSLKKSRFISEIDSLSSQFSLDQIDENFSNAGEYQVNTEAARIGDLIYHKNYHEGVIVAEDSEFITVAFNKKTGIKEILKGHNSYVLKL
ncbi:MAG: AAA family ATPase [Mycoplasmataceae bacterium]|nr:AAA family ATPase [Mycoplasmataceae bacterium]